MSLKKITAGLGFLLLLAAVAFGAETKGLVISFEQSEGFPAAGQEFSGKGIPATAVSAWIGDSPDGIQWFIDDGPGGAVYPDAPPPISGKQMAGLGQAGSGVNTGSLVLKKEANLGLDSFYWAWRGNGDSRPGGNAYLEVEYFDLEGKSVGPERFQGGLNPDWSPKFELAKVSVQGGALSKVIFRGVPPDPANGHGMFFLDEMKLSARAASKVSFKTMEATPVSSFRQQDTTPPTLTHPTPPADSTVAGAVEIGAKFADAGSGVDTASAHLLLDGKEVTANSKVTTEGILFLPAAALEKGIHRVEVRVADKTGNQGNRLAWRFGVGVPVPVPVRFEKGVFLVGGEPWFPIGIYNGSCDPMSLTRKDLNITEERRSYVQKCLSEAAASGINCPMLSESMSGEDLDVLLKNGMKGMKSVSYALGNISQADTTLMQRHAAGLKDHPGLLARWASDPETMEVTRKNMALGYKVLKENDPNHPVIWVLSHSDKYKECVATSDACFVYDYPIMQGNKTVYSLYTDVLYPAFQAAAPSGKQVWFASQGIDLRICEGERLASPDEFRPTAAEIRAMNYLALSKGIKGLFFYAQGGSPTPGVYNDLTEYPAQWKETLKIASEVRFLSPALAVGAVATTAALKTDNPAVHCRELEYDGTHTLIAVNTGATSAYVSWEFPGPVQPEALFEDRVLSQKGTRMTDKFGPLEVHIYRWKQVTP